MKKISLILAFGTCLVAQLDNGLADVLDKDLNDDADHPPYQWSAEMNPEDPIENMLFISFRTDCLDIQKEGELHDPKPH